MTYKIGALSHKNNNLLPIGLSVYKQNQKPLTFRNSPKNIFTPTLIVTQNPKNPHIQCTVNYAYIQNSTSHKFNKNKYPITT